MSSNTTNTSDNNDASSASNSANTLSSNPDILDRSQLSRATQLPTHNVFRMPKKNTDNTDGDDALNTTTDPTTTANTTINATQPSGSGSSGGTHLPTHNVSRPAQHAGNVASGLEATLNNPHVSEERKEEAKERLDGTSM